MTLTPADVHTPGVMDKKKARGFLEAWKRLLLLNKRATEGLYVGRRVSNEYELKSWCAKLGYVLDADPHVTVLYSSVAIPWVDQIDYLKADISGWQILGDENAVVLTVSCPELDVRWQNAIKAGAKSTYDSYIPHVTLFYLGPDADTSGFVLPDLPPFPLYLEGERSADLGVSTASVFKAVVHFPAGTPGGKGGQFAPSGTHGGAFAYHPGGVGSGQTPHPAGPGNVHGAITKYDTAEVVAMRSAAAAMVQTHTLPGRHGIQARALAASYGSGAAVKGKEAHIVIGGPGSGKSTVGDDIAQQRGALVVDADVVKTHIPEYNGGKNAGGVHEESLGITAQVLRTAIGAGDNIVLPTTGRTRAYVDGITQQLQSKGYTIHLHYVDVHPDIAVARTLDRARQTGRFVDPVYTANVVGTNPKATFHALQRDTRYVSATAYDNNVDGARPSVTSTRGNNGLSGAGHGSGLPPGSHAPGGTTLQVGPHPSTHAHPTAAAAPHIQRLGAAVVGASPAAAQGLVTIHGNLTAALSGGTSAIPRAYNSAVQQLQQAFATHGNTPGALTAAISSIKGPPAGHTFGQKFAALRTQALSLVATAAPPKPAIPVAPVLPSTLPSNKATWNGNTLLRIQQVGSNPNLSPAQMQQQLAGISISSHHHPMVKAYHAAMLAHTTAPGVGSQPHVPVVVQVVAAVAPRAPKVPKGPVVPTPIKAGIQVVPGTKTVAGTQWDRRGMRQMYAAAKVGDWAQVARRHQHAVNAVGHYPQSVQYGAALLAHQAAYGLTQGQGNPVSTPRPVAAIVQPTAPVVHTAALPPAPPINPAFAHKAANFNARIAQFQAAAAGPNPIQALNAIAVNTPPMKAYQAALIAHVTQIYTPYMAAMQAASLKVSASPGSTSSKAGKMYAATAIDSYRPAQHAALESMAQVHGLIRAGNQGRIKQYVHTTQPGDHQLAAVYKAQGFDGLPKVVTRDEFDKLVTGGGLEMFRTVNGVPGRSATQLVDDFKTGDYYAGFGVHGNGTYVAAPAKGTKLAFGVRSGDAPRKDSSHYARGSSDSQMFRMVLKPDAKIGSKDTIYRSQMAKLQHIQNLKRVAQQANDQTEYKKLDHEEDFHRDLGRHAASLGYDAYSAGKGGRSGAGTKKHKSQYVIVLNRTAVAVRDITEHPSKSPVD